MRAMRNHDPDHGQFRRCRADLVGGKIFTAIVLLCGVGIVAVPTGLVAAALTKLSQNKDGPSGE